MMATYEEFKSQVLGKAYDIDGYYGCQCWDGYAKYCNYLGIPICHCTSTGYVQDIWMLRKSNGILNYCTEVSVLKAGDIVVFKKYGSVTPLSHIAIFDSDAGGGYGNFLGQNQGGKNGAFNLVRLPYAATYDTAFRPKNLSTGQTVYWNFDAVLKAGDVVSSKTLAITKIDKAKDQVYVPGLGGWVPCSDLDESDLTQDGKYDQILSNVNAKVWLAETTVQAVDTKNNLVKVNGYWVKPDYLCRKEYK